MKPNLGDIWWQLFFHLEKEEVSKYCVWQPFIYKLDSLV